MTFLRVIPLLAIAMLACGEVQLELGKARQTDGGAGAVLGSGGGAEPGGVGGRVLPHGGAGMGPDGSGTSGAPPAGRGGAGLGTAGAMGGSPPAAVDPEHSRNWTWDRCGEVGSGRVRASHVQFLTASEGVAVRYADSSWKLHALTFTSPPRTLRAAKFGTAITALSADGALIAEDVRNSEELLLRDTASGEETVRFASRGDCAPTKLEFSLDGQHLLAFAEQALCVWRLPDGAFVARIAGSAASAVVANDRILIADETDASRIAVRSLPGLELSYIQLRIPAGTTLWKAARIAPRGDAFTAEVGVGGTYDSTVVWSGDGTMLLRGASSPAVFSPDGRRALFSKQIITLPKGDAESKVPLQFEWYGQASALDTSGTRLVELTQGLDGSEGAAAYDLQTQAGLGLFGDWHQATRSVVDMALSSDATQLLLVRAQPELWNLAPEFARSWPAHWIPAPLPLHAEFLDGDGEVLVSGDTWSISSAQTRSRRYEEPAGPQVDLDCPFTKARKAPHSGRLMVGGYGRYIRVLDSDPRIALARLPTARCNARAAMSDDERYVATTGPELYRTSDWQRVWPRDIVEEEGPFVSALNDVQFVPGDRELLVTQCSDTPDLPCRHRLYSVENGALLREYDIFTGQRVAYSREGHWAVSGNVLAHLPSQAVRALDDTVETAIFTQGGDIIAAVQDGSLLRYCRRASP